MKNKEVKLEYFALLKMLSSPRELLRLFARWILLSVAIVLSALLLPNLGIKSVGALLGLSFLLIVVNTLIVPAVNRLFLKYTIYTFGALALLINAISFLIVIHLEVGIRFEGGLLDAVITSTLIVGFLAMLSALTGSGYSETWRYLYRSRFKKGPVKKSTKRGIIFLEVDGLSVPVFMHAIKNGFAPTMEKWLKNTHSLVEWETDLSSQTSASQAGILHGNNKDIPAFRWFDRKKQEVFVSNHAKDSKLKQKLISNGQGLLAKGGVTFNNMFTGDAPHAALSMSGIGTVDQRQEALKLYFTSPLSLFYSLAFMAHDVFIEIRSGIMQQIKNETPRISRDIKYVAIRPFTTVLLRDLSVYRIVDAMFRKAPSLYTTFVGYDEVAHHAGITNKSSMHVLKRLDAEFAKLEEVERYTDVKYDFIVLSDHGQSEGTTFEDKYGYSLSDLVDKLTGENMPADKKVEESEHSGNVRQLLSLMPFVKFREKKEKVDKPVITMASGNQGLIYIRGHKQRLTKRRLTKLYPKLIDGLAKHRGIGFVFVNTERGPVAIGSRGKHFIKSGKVIGKDPLSPYKHKNLVRHLKRYNTFTNAPDIMVISSIGKNGEVGAFEHLVGSHGGVGGPQTRPFILYPRHLKMPKKEIVGAQEVHKVLKSWTV